MKYTITDYFGDRVELEPCLELYTVRDFMGKEMPGLAIQLYFVDEEFGEPELYEDLTVCFGEFISLRNAAYIDTNNCYFAPQLLEQGIAKDTGLKNIAVSVNIPSGCLKRTSYAKSVRKTIKSILRPTIRTTLNKCLIL